MKRFPTKPSSGFSLIELVITMTILSILVGVVSFRSSAVVGRSKVSKISSLVDTLKTACTLHHIDTGSYAVEYTGYAANNRKLTGTQSTAGWSGPYLETPLSHNNHNPYGQLNLYNTVTANGWINGFDLDGDGTDDVTGAANMLHLADMPAEAAETLNDTFDRGIDGDWQDTGRVRYDSGTKRAFVLIYYQ
ncbi:MAG: general secretion pathway protein G [Planctomycetota bacterium]|jgi:general secretion pathway protein G